uniref:UPAR/Ly6 domain-containing protein n=1 Tax=Pygocentrus nattereri TaxID=42514 RepID=A0A3B4CN81_PYGNA
MTQPGNVCFSSTSLLKVMYAFCLCAFLLPGWHCANLLCYYCPLQLVNKPCKHVLTECLPGQKCFTADGHYGGYSGVFSKGCTFENKCLRKNSQIIQESNISLDYSCCSYDYCNSSQSLSLLTQSSFIIADTSFLLGTGTG